MRTLLSRKEAAARLQISVDTLDVERASGHLAYIQRKPGGKVWITEDAIAEYLERATHPARPKLRTGTDTIRRRRV
ncbi:helix-turn-helix domain-containing protein [uncultured Mailhella sp.]|uniref:helix-turn-helix domain-containing protein n=1 Tax=uncultured Mailhella sp. TaxID=1981031 RepID=UPI00262E97C6|nr:helix-turn-helix domain-containing protein [uncultured Mailhella sp.]